MFSELNLCSGIENIPVYVENSITDDDFPTFQYTPENIAGAGCESDPSELTLPGCECCSQSCQPESCACLRSHGQTYDGVGCFLEPAGNYSQPVFECNALCGCGESCSNRVVQKGLTLRLCLFPALKKGLGVCTLDPVCQGRFVCEYAGEVIGYQEACRRQKAQKSSDRNYIIAVREHGGAGKVSETFVDPAKVGNVGRFLNHSCQPNLFMVPVRVHSVVPRLALFASRDIAPYEELTFDYSGGLAHAVTMDASPMSLKSDSRTDTERKPCYCGAQSCSRYLPLDVSIINN